MNTLDDLWDDWTTSYDDAIFTDDFTSAACEVARTAQSIVHEMLHGCLWFGNEQADSQGDCDLSYMLGSAFQWAMAQRYPCLTAASGCDDWADSSNFMNDTVTY